MHQQLGVSPKSSISITSDTPMAGPSTTKRLRTMRTQWNMTSLHAMQDLSIDQVVSLVSCTVWQERAEAGQKVREDMQGAFHALQEAARRVGKVTSGHAFTLQSSEPSKCVGKQGHPIEMFVYKPHVCSSTCISLFEVSWRKWVRACHRQCGSSSGVLLTDFPMQKG